MSRLKSWTHQVVMEIVVVQSKAGHRHFKGPKFISASSAGYTNRRYVGLNSIYKRGYLQGVMYHSIKWFDGY